jgi:hypothetical protein
METLVVLLLVRDAQLLRVYLKYTGRTVILPVS